MSAFPVDEEKGEGDVFGHADSHEHTIVSTQSSPTVVGSPQFSHSTFPAISADASPEKIRPLRRSDRTWSQRVNSFKTVVGLTSSSKKSGADDDNQTSSDEEDDVDEEGPANETIVRKIHDQPKGYPRLATFLDSDENFMVYRRFGYLQSRLLLDRQAELAALESDLDRMERLEARDPRLAVKLYSRKSNSTEKKALLDTIEVKWNAYCQLLSNASNLAALHKPAYGEYRSVRTWLDNVKPVVPTEARFIQCQEDLVILRPGREHAWLDTGIERTLKWIGWAPLRKVFQSRDTQVKSDGLDGTLLFTRGRINNVVVGIITLMILALLIVPIYVLFYLSEHSSSHTSVQSIGVLLVSTLAFSACISLFTRARRHEILAASAAYCAVLVVFIGNLTQHLS